jgi:hypothetical protein
MSKPIKLSKQLEWLRLFLPCARHYVSLKKIKRICGYKVPLNKAEDGVASCTKQDNGKYTIFLLIRQQEMESRRGRIKYTKRHFDRCLNEILNDLAHELAHIPTWSQSGDHTCDRWILEGKLITSFARKAKRLKVKDTWVAYNTIEQLKISEPDEDD